MEKIKKIIIDMLSEYSLERIGHLYFWDNANKAKFIADATALVFLTAALSSFLLTYFPDPDLNISYDNQVWSIIASLFSAALFFFIRFFSALVKNSNTLSHIALILNMAALSLCLPLLFSTVGLFDGFCWVVLFVYAAVGFVVLEPRYIVGTQAATLTVMMLITFNPEPFPYRIRAYMVGFDAYIDNFSTIDLIFKWLVMSLATLIGMTALAYLTSVWQRREEDLREISAKDELTGLMNRRSIFECLEREVQQFHDLQKPVSIAMVDLDHFKNINDTYGHPFGDKALKLVAREVQGIIRKDDAVGRFGGEEFLVVFSNCPAKHACNSINRLREVLSAKPLTADDGEQVIIKLSAGVSEYTENSTIDELVTFADERLYKAKEQGRNRVVME